MCQTHCCIAVDRARLASLRRRRYQACVLRSAFAPLALPLLALVAGVARWLAQGSGNLYTALAKRFYVPDPDFGWREAAERPVWLGLEALGLLAGVTFAVLIAALWIGRRQRAGKSTKLLRALAWTVSPLPLVLPLVAFASGGAPAGAKDALPMGATAAAPQAGIDGALPVPAGEYEVLAHRGTVITAKIKAGGDELEARFAGDPRGTWQAEPADFSRPMQAEVSVAAASIDTGIDLRTEHAKKDYLKVAEHPRIGFRLTRLVAARQDGPSLVAFRGVGQIELLGHETEIEITGNLVAADAAQKARLELPVERAVVVVTASFILPVAKTALSPGDYDTDQFPVSISLVLAHRK